MKTKYAATFSNGQTITRTSDRTYRAAWLFHYTGFSGAPAQRSGFARDVATARRTMANEGRLWGGGKPLLFSEVVELA